MANDSSSFIMKSKRFLDVGCDEEKGEPAKILNDAEDGSKPPAPKKVARSSSSSIIGANAAATSGVAEAEVVGRQYELVRRIMTHSSMLDLKRFSKGAFRNYYFT